METIMGISITIVGLLGISALLLESGKQYRDANTMSDMYDYSRQATERLFQDISETSVETISAKTTDVRPTDGLRDDVIAFASARDENGVFQTGSYGAFGFTRPSWQKAIIYYLLPDSGNGYGKTLYRKEILKTDWSTPYNPVSEMDEDGEPIAWNVDYMYFGPAYPEINPTFTRKNKVLDVSLGFLRTKEQMDTGLERTVAFSTGIPMMNGTKK